MNTERLRVERIIIYDAGHDAWFHVPTRAWRGQAIEEFDFTNAGQPGHVASGPFATQAEAARSLTQ